MVLSAGSNLNLSVMMIKLCVLVLMVASIHGKVTDKDVDISNTLDEINIIEEIKKIVEDDNIITNNEHAIATDSKKTCLDIDNDVNSEDRPCENDNKVDNGTALILTPFIEEGRIQEARNASKVDSSHFLGVESYSGFLTVDKELKSHLFFWYFPALNLANDTPWLIWLQGGPGASSLTGLFDEIGPFRVRPDQTLIRNPYTWLVNHSLVFLDNPVGTGYSFTESEDGFARDMPTYARHMHTATKQLVQIFLELRTMPLYVAGESYAGKYVPALAMEIHKHRHYPGGDINLKGVMLGNAYIEPDMISEVVRPFYHFGLLEKEQIDFARPLIDGFQSDIANNRSVEAKKKWVRLIVTFLTMSHLQHGYNFLRDELNLGSYATFLTKSEIKRAIHVGDIKFSVLNTTVNTELAPEFLSNARPLFEELLEHYRVLAYCGQLDQMLPCAFTSETYRKWKWSGSNAFLESTRHAYVLNRRLTGYHKSGGGLTWAVIRGAGHMVPMDTPGPILRLVSLWTRAEPLPTGPHIDSDFLSALVGNNTTKESTNEDSSSKEVAQKEDQKVMIYL